MEMCPNSRKSVIVCGNYIPSVESVVQSTNNKSEQGSGSVSLVGPLALLSLLVMDDSQFLLLIRCYYLFLFSLFLAYSLKSYHIAYSLFLEFL